MTSAEGAPLAPAGAAPGASSRGQLLCGLAGFLGAVALLTLRAITDLDFGFYLAVGRETLARGIPQQEFYLPLLPPAPFASQWLLAAPLFELAWRAAGPAGLIVLKSLCIAGGFLAAALAAVPRGARPHVALVLASVAAATVSARFIERPGFFSVLLLGLVLLLCGPEAETKRRFVPNRVAFAALPVLFSLWSFLHAEWLLGLWAAGVLLAARQLRGELPLVPPALSLAASLLLPGALFAALHPSGLLPLIEPFRFLLGRVDEFEVAEYSPLLWILLMPSGAWLLAGLLTSAPLWRTRGWPEALGFLVLLVLAVKAPRGALPAVLFSIPFVVDFLSRRERAPFPAWLALVLPLAVAAPFVADRWESTGRLRLDAALDARGIGRVLERISVREGPVLANFGWCSVLLSQPGTVRQGVVMDGRQEAYSLQYLREVYFPLLTVGSSAWEQRVRSSPVGFYFEPWPRGESDLTYAPDFERLGWELIAWDGAGRLWARPGIAQRHGFPPFTVDPARLTSLRNASGERLLQAREEVAGHAQSLLIEGIPAPRALIAAAELSLAVGDPAGALGLLRTARKEGGERYSVFGPIWREAERQASDAPPRRSGVR